MTPVTLSGPRLVVTGAAGRAGWSGQSGDMSSIPGQDSDDAGHDHAHFTRLFETVTTSSSS